MVDRRLRERERAATAESSPAARARLYAEEARAGRARRRRVAGCWLERELPGAGSAELHLVLHAASATEQLLRLFPAAVATRWEERVRRAAGLRRRLRHPSIPAVHEVGLTPDGGDERLFVREEYVPGRTALDLLRGRGGLGAASAVRAVREVAEGLADVHAAGFVHGRVSPLSLLLGDDGGARLVGWSSVRALTDPPAQVLPAPYFLAPEQLRGGRLDARTDVYGLSATLFTLLTDRYPFQGSTLPEVTARITRAPAPDLRAAAPDLPGDLARLLRRGMAKRLEERPPLALFLEGLDASGGRVSSRRPRRPRRRPLRALWRAALGSRED